MGFAQLIFAIRGAFRQLTGKVAPTVYADEIEEHFHKVFGIANDDHRVFHELMSDVVHIDVHVAAPSAERPFYLLFTTGMSDLPMTLPDDCSWDFRQTRERAELFCLLPPDWKFGDFANEAEQKRYMWIISCLKTAARYPHKCGNWLGSMHSLQYSDDNAPFADNTGFSSAAFLQLDYKDFGGRYGDELNMMRTKDGKYINMLCFIPLYEDEMNLKIDKGGGELFMRLFGETVTDFSQITIDINRESVCFNKNI